MEQIQQYKCPLCSKQLPAQHFVDKESEDFLELGFISTRECRGKKGMPEISRIALVQYSDQQLGKEIIAKLKHDCLGLIHALEKQKLISESDLEFTSGDTKELKDALLDANGQIEMLKNKVKEFDNALLDANGEIDKFKRIARKYKDTLLDANAQIDILENSNNSEEEIKELRDNLSNADAEIERLKNLVEQYENASFG